MAQYFFDLLYNFTDCMCCFPSTPQLKINNRSFKLLRLLGEVSSDDEQPKRPSNAWHNIGRFLLCLPRPGQVHIRAFRAEKNPMPLRSGIRFAGPEGSRGV